MADGNPSHLDAIFAHRRRTNRTMSECSDVSTSSDTQGQSPNMERQTSVGPAEMMMAGTSAPANISPTSPGMRSTTPEVLLYDKYLSKFFNPLHTVPNADNAALAQRQRGVLYDVDGKFAYTTYSERSYHPMIDIKKFTAKESPE